MCRRGLNTGCWVLGAGCCVLSSVRWFLVSECWFLVLGFRFSGFWVSKFPCLWVQGFSVSRFLGFLVCGFLDSRFSVLGSGFSCSSPPPPHPAPPNLQTGRSKAILWSSRQAAKRWSVPQKIGDKKRSSTSFPLRLSAKLLSCFFLFFFVFFSSRVLKI